jgi:bifunctional DNA-binding transcriptional regulator/antitoxin component of YhaV-PrlF toxin-antitoxin module
MDNTIKMDRYGRVVIPQVVRERYGLVEGSSYDLEIRESPEGIVLRPAFEEIPVERDPSGWLIFQSGEEDNVDPVEAVQDAREQRDREVRGGA